MTSSSTAVTHVTFEAASEFDVPMRRVAQRAVWSRSRDAFGCTRNSPTCAAPLVGSCASGCGLRMEGGHEKAIAYLGRARDDEPGVGERHLHRLRGRQRRRQLPRRLQRRRAATSRRGRTATSAATRSSTSGCSTSRPPRSARSRPTSRCSPRSATLPPSFFWTTAACAAGPIAQSIGLGTLIASVDAVASRWEIVNFFHAGSLRAAHQRASRTRSTTAPTPGRWASSPSSSARRARSGCSGSGSARSGFAVRRHQR